MTNYMFPQQCQLQPNRSPNWYNRFQTYLTLDPSRTHESAPGLSANSKSTPSAIAGKQAAEGRWTERAIAYDLTNRKE